MKKVSYEVIEIVCQKDRYIGEVKHFRNFEHADSYFEGVCVGTMRIYDDGKIDAFDIRIIQTATNRVIKRYTNMNYDSDCELRNLLG